MACSVWLHYTLDQLEQYLESLLVDDGRDQAIVTNVVQAFRRFKSLPAADDAAAVAPSWPEKHDTIRAGARRYSL